MNRRQFLSATCASVCSLALRPFLAQAQGEENMMQIQGSCNRCGQCCGAPGSPNRDSPWPNNWPEAVATWRISYLAETFPVFQLTGHPALGGEVARVVRINNKNYSLRWVPGHGLCKNTPPLNDPNTWEEQCPFLMDQLPDDSYPCALAGTQWNQQYVQCMDMGEYWDEASVAEWQANHPLCSYTFVEV
jgi:hypothetical protein